MSSTSYIRGRLVISSVLVLLKIAHENYSILRIFLHFCKTYQGRHRCSVDLFHGSYDSNYSFSSFSPLRSAENDRFF